MRRVLAFFLCAALLLAACPAGAALSPRLSSLLSGGATVRLSFRAERLDGLTDDALSEVARLLARTTVTLTEGTQDGASAWRMGLFLDGDTLADIGGQTVPSGRLVRMLHSGGAYLTGAEERDAMTLLFGAAEAWPDVENGLSAFFAALPGLDETLAGEDVTVRDGRSATSIQNVGTAPSSRQYTLSGEALTMRLPRALEPLRAGLAAAFPTAPDRVRTWMDTLSGWVFEGDARIKRMFARDGSDMGLQLTGKAVAAEGEKAKKITLFMGHQAEKGFYISLTLGKDTWTARGKQTGSEKQNTLAFSAASALQQGGKTVKASLEGSLKCVPGDGGERITGKITRVTRPGGVKTTLVLQPDVIVTEGGAQGEVRCTLNRKDTTVTDVTVTLEAAPAAAPILPAESAAPVDLTGLSDTAALALAGREESVLSRLLIRALSGLSENTRAHLVHALRTADFMTAPVVPLTGETDSGDEWIVEEEP